MPTRIHTFDVGKLLELWNPWAVWGLRVTPREVERAVAKDVFESRSWNSREAFKPPKFSHAGRIAHLVVHGWSDPIEVDVGCGSLGGYFCVEDGNHRLCAAQVRGDKSILASAGGLVSEIKRLTYRKTEP